MESPSPVGGCRAVQGGWAPSTHTFRPRRSSPTAAATDTALAMVRTTIVAAFAATAALAASAVPDDAAAATAAAPRNAAPLSVDAESSTEPRRRRPVGDPVCGTRGGLAPVGFRPEGGGGRAGVHASCWGERVTNRARGRALWAPCLAPPSRPIRLLGGARHSSDGLVLPYRRLVGGTVWIICDRHHPGCGALASCWC